MKDSAKRNWRNPKHKEKMIKKILQSLSKRPLKTEKKLNQILQKCFPNEWKYVGDGSFLIGYKNPDFINVNGKKICIELYHAYFKIKAFGSCERYEEQRNNHFAKYGWNTLFIQGFELDNEEALIDKIKNYLESGDLLLKK